MLEISNIYAHGFDDLQLSVLERLGFSFRPQVSMYAGAQKCRFIDFEAWPCLELIDVENANSYLDFLPKGMIPYCPGISLVSPAGSRETIADYERKFAHLQPYFLHANYDGSETPRGSGWNYLNFAISPVQDTFFWLTGFDEPRPVREHKTVHPNHVKGIAGLLFDLEIESLRELAQMVGKESQSSEFSIGGVQVWPRNALAHLPIQKDKVFPLVTIVLQAESLNCFDTAMEGISQTEFMARPAVHIQLNKLSWDLLITEN